VQRHRLALLFAVLIAQALAGAAGIVYATVRGAATSIDSLAYIGAARTLLQGDGLLALAYDGTFQPMTHYPPFYSVLLAAVGLFGIDPLDAARGGCALFMAANVLLSGLAIYRLTRGLWWPAILGALLMLLAPGITMVHAWAWAEPPFLLLCILAFLLLDVYTHSARRGALWLAGAVLGLACLTRYTGLALVATAALWVLWSGPGAGRRRLTDALLLGLLGCVPLGLWFARNLLVSGGLADRQIIYHPITGKLAREGLATLAQWVLPGRAPSLWLALIPIALFVLVLGAGLVLQSRSSDASDAERVARRAPLVPGLFVLVYAVTLLVSISWFDAHTPLDDRILSPAYCAGLICVLSTLGVLLRRAHWSLTLVASALALTLCGLSATANLAYLHKLHREGAGYASRTWTTSPLMQLVRELPADTPLVSNVPDGIYALTGRPAAWLPYEVHAGTQQRNAAFDDELRALAADYGVGDGRVVYSAIGTWRWYLPTLETLKSAIALETEAAVSDGEILRFVVDE
jgi:4-amino-4-deoxy-L-arabinose transferase-like glycosyltransferase